MFIAHLPAGYLAGRLAKLPYPIMVGLLIGSVAPDVDMLWFYFVDGGTTHHHEYITHRPITWAALLAIALVSRVRILVGIGVGGLLHLVLDSIAGKVSWAWPFSDMTVTLVEVPATQSHWILSFLLHWTFMVEIALVLLAVVVFILTRRSTS